MRGVVIWLFGMVTTTLIAYKQDKTDKTKDKTAAPTESSWVEEEGSRAGSRGWGGVHLRKGGDRPRRA